MREEYKVTPADFLFAQMLVRADWEAKFTRIQYTLFLLVLNLLADPKNVAGKLLECANILDEIPTLPRKKSWNFWTECRAVFYFFERKDFNLLSRGLANIIQKEISRKLGHHLQKSPKMEFWLCHLPENAVVTKFLQCQFPEKIILFLGDLKKENMQKQVNNGKMPIHLQPLLSKIVRNLIYFEQNSELSKNSLGAEAVNKLNEDLANYLADYFLVEFEKNYLLLGLKNRFDHFEIIYPESEARKNTEETELASHLETLVQNSDLSNEEIKIYQAILNNF